MLGDFKSAGEYFERAAAKNPQELVKAAEARLMMGDLKGADALFAKLLRPRGRMAQLSDGAMGVPQRDDGSRAWHEWKNWRRVRSGDFQSVVLSQLAIWKLDVGETKAAADLAAQAATKAQSPQAAGHQRDVRGHRLWFDRLRFEAGRCLSAAIRAANYRETLPLLQAVYSETSPSAERSGANIAGVGVCGNGRRRQGSAIIGCLSPSAVVGRSAVCFADLSGIFGSREVEF